MNKALKFLNVKKVNQQPKATKSNKKETLKDVIMQDLKKTMLERLATKWGDYFKWIDANSYPTIKGDNDNRDIKQINGKMLLIPTTKENESGEAYDGDVWRVAEPTIYFKGYEAKDESNIIYEYKEVAKITIQEPTQTK